jgi:hypothetical protein
MVTLKFDQDQAAGRDATVEERCMAPCAIGRRIVDVPI